jgi:hypothetical protein
MSYLSCPNPRTAGELITALESGKILGRSQRYDVVESSDHWECIYYQCSRGQIYLGVWGWGSALGTVKDRLYDLVVHPEVWHIGTIPLNPKTKFTTDFVPDDPIKEPRLSPVA